MIRKRIYALLLACALLTAALCGCGRDAALTVTLRTMSTLGDEAEYNIYSGMMTAFSAAYPDIYVRDVTVPAADAFRLKVSGDGAVFKASDAPHVIYYANAGGLEQVSDYLVPVDEIINDYPDFVSGVSVEVLNSMRLADGKSYCVPAAGEWTALVINRSLFEEKHIDIPTDWNGLLEAVTRFSAEDVIPFANPADEGAAIIEALVGAYGGSDAVNLGLDGYSNIVAEAWKPALECYRELCARGAFPPAAVTDAITAALTPVSATDAVIPAEPRDYASVLGFDRDRSLRADADKLFCEGKAAMILLDNTGIAGINYTENCEIIRFPSPLGGSAELPGGFRSGFAITRRAYDDPYLRDAAVAFVDLMTGADACAQFAQLGYLPADGSSLGQGIVGDVCAVRDNYYGVSARSGAYLSGWNSINRMAGQLYYGVLSPEDICASLANPELIWVDPSALPEEPEETVSASDVPVASGSDLMQINETD